MQYAITKTKKFSVNAFWNRTDKINAWDKNLKKFLISTFLK